MYESLDPQASIPGAFNVSSPIDTSNYSTSIVLYDSLEIDHNIIVYFRKSTEAAVGNSWKWYAVVGADESSSGIAEIQVQGTLVFTNFGSLNTESAMTYNLASGGFDFSGGAAAGQQISFDFGMSIHEGGSGLEGTTQRASSEWDTSNVTISENLDPTASIVCFNNFYIRHCLFDIRYSLLCFSSLFISIHMPIQAGQTQGAAPTFARQISIQE